MNRDASPSAMNVTIEGKTLVVNDELEITACRTLRVPDNANVYDLPKGLGQFPIMKVSDYEGDMPEEWRQHGGVIIPMHFCEAMYWQFRYRNQPYAVQFAAGMVNCIDGKPYDNALRQGGYMVVPPQNFLDGLNSGDGTIRQFVATRMGDGHSIEAQVTGEEKYGGVQLSVYAPLPGSNLTPRVRPRAGDKNAWEFTNNTLEGWAGSNIKASYSSNKIVQPNLMTSDARRSKSVSRFSPEPQSLGFQKSLLAEDTMSLGAGGKITQKIYHDPYGIGVWDQYQIGRVYVHIVSAAAWAQMTGEWHPTPISQSTYQSNGTPWYKVYDSYMPDIPASPILKRVKSLKQLEQDEGSNFAPYDKPMNSGIAQSAPYSQPPKNNNVKDGDWK